MSMSCSIITSVMSRGSSRIKPREALPLARRQSRARLVEQHDFRIGRERERKLELAPLPIGEELHRLVGAPVEADTRKHNGARVAQIRERASGRCMVHLRRSVPSIARSRFSITVRSVHTLEIWNVRAHAEPGAAMFGEPS